MAESDIKSMENINWRNISLGVIGLLLIIYGNFLPPHNTQKGLFLVGCIFLLTSSVLEKNKFFSILQIVVLSGTLIAFAPVSLVFKAGVPISLSILAIIYFMLQGMLSDSLTIVGCLGLLFLAAGYAISNPIVYLLGGLFLTIYSYYSYKQGVNIALIFAILNAVFTVTAGVGVYRLL